MSPRASKMQAAASAATKRRGGAVNFHLLCMVRQAHPEEGKKGKIPSWNASGARRPTPPFPSPPKMSHPQPLSGAIFLPFSSSDGWSFRNFPLLIRPPPLPLSLLSLLPSDTWVKRGPRIPPLLSPYKIAKYPLFFLAGIYLFWHWYRQQRRLP